MNAASRMLLVSALLTGILLCAGEVAGQSVQGTNRFVRQLDAVSWSLNTRADYLSETLRFSMDNRLSSRLFLFNDQAQNIQDEQDHLLQFQYALNPHFGINTRAGSYRFTNTNLRQDHALIGFYLQPYESLQIAARAGFLSDQRSEQSDQGLNWQVSLTTPELQLSDFRIKPEILADRAYINPRELYTFRYGTTMDYLSQDNLSLNALITASSTRRDSYQSGSLLNRTESSFVESIESDSTRAFILTETPIGNRMTAEFSIDALSNVRRILNSPLEAGSNITLFDSRSDRQFLDTGVALHRRQPGLQLQIGARWALQVRESRLINTEGLPEDQVRRRSEILENSNFSQRRFELFTRNRVQVSERYEILISGSTSILRYNTPDFNQDDRDELAMLLRTVHEYRISDVLRSRVTLAGEAFHVVYLFSERSIENNWRRSLRLIPELTWQPSPVFEMNHRFTVRANYTVEDYELANRPKNDQSAREFIANSAMSWTFAPNWNLQAEVSRSELRIGRLFWDTFQETPIDTITTWDFSGMFSRRYDDVVISTGLRYFHKTDFLQRASLAVEIPDNGSVIRASRIATGKQTTSQWGPAVTIRLPLSARNELYLNGWLQFQATRQKLYTDYPENFREAFLQAERSADRRTYPNLEITTRFNF